MTRRPSALLLAAVLGSSLLLGACDAGTGAPSLVSPASPAPGTVSEAPGTVSEAPGTVSQAPGTVSEAPSLNDNPPETPGTASPRPHGSDGATSGNAGGPVVTPVPIGPVAPGSSAGPILNPPATEVQPVANLLDIHDVRAESVAAAVSGSDVTATVVWWSGPAPCSALAEIRVARSGSAFTLTIREGSEQLGVACPAIAMHKQATVDLGHLAPGTYTVAATGVDAPISVAVPG